MYGDFPAKNTVCTPYIPIHLWFWPTLHVPVRASLVLEGVALSIPCPPFAERIRLAATTWKEWVKDTL